MRPVKRYRKKLSAEDLDDALQSHLQKRPSSLACLIREARWERQFKPPTFEQLISWHYLAIARGDWQQADSLANKIQKFPSQDGGWGLC